MSRPRSPIEILIDRACGVPEQPTANDVSDLERFAHVVAIDACDHLIAFLGLDGSAKAVLGKQATVDFIMFDIRRRMEGK